MSRENPRLQSVTPVGSLLEILTRMVLCSGVEPSSRHLDMLAENGGNAQVYLHNILQTIGVLLAERECLDEADRHLTAAELHQFTTAVTVVFSELFKRIDVMQAQVELYQAAAELRDYRVRQQAETDAETDAAHSDQGEPPAH